MHCHCRVWTNWCQCSVECQLHKCVSFQLDGSASVPQPSRSGNQMPPTDLAMQRRLFHFGYVGKAVSIGQLQQYFFPSNAFMASARSFNTFNCMLQIGLQGLISAYTWPSADWEAIKSELIQARLDSCSSRCSRWHCAKAHLRGLWVAPERW